MKSDTDYKKHQNSISLWYKLIQHISTRKRFYLQNFLLDSDLKIWTEFFEESMSMDAKKKRPSLTDIVKGINIGLQIHPINYGRKYGGYAEWSIKRGK